MLTFLLQSAFQSVHSNLVQGDDNRHIALVKWARKPPYLTHSHPSLFIEAASVLILYPPSCLMRLLVSQGSAHWTVAIPHTEVPGC